MTSKCLEWCRDRDTIHTRSVRTRVDCLLFSSLRFFAVRLGPKFRVEEVDERHTETRR